MMYNSFERRHKRTKQGIGQKLRYNGKQAAAGALALLLAVVPPAGVTAAARQNAAIDTSVHFEAAVSAHDTIGHIENAYPHTIARVSEEGQIPARADSYLLKRQAGRETSAIDLPDTIVLSTQPETGIAEVRPADGIDHTAWLERLAAHPDTAYVHPNSEVSLLAVKPNDPNYGKQDYLKLIGADRAWETANEQTLLTIAVIDTGVDQEHPDLKDNLVPGVNLVSPGELPQDDNGHGTSVAGVLAAVGNNGVGTTGVLWKAKIMPIKALDQTGLGDERRLGEAILQAVDRGAKIVVLSVGLYRYSPYLRDIAAYAEQHGVLLVAASGNDGLTYGSKAAVKYPAAYPTVLSVAGAAADGTPERRSNAGPENDIAAAWNVYTTALGGGYKTEVGTSVAAPQVAAAAALVWARYPDLQVHEVRERLLQTARDIGPPGRDNQSGTGLLQVDAALTAEVKPDPYEPNNTRSQAKQLALTNQYAAVLNSGKDTDWYRLNVTHDAVLTIQIQGLPMKGEKQPDIRVTLRNDSGIIHTSVMGAEARPIEVQVKQGAYDLSVAMVDPAVASALPYLLTPDVRMAPDAYESNDTPETAAPLEVNAEVTGSFHRTGDLDWYAVTVKSAGDLRITLNPSTIRIDPALLVRRSGGDEQRIDDYGDGAIERTSIPVKPGRYLIRVRNAASAEAIPVVGTYTLSVEFEQQHEDPNEPNNRMFTATPLAAGIDYAGVFDTAEDEDWFQLRLDAPSIVGLRLSGVPIGRTVTMSVFDKRQQPLFETATSLSEGKLSSSREYPAGTYYIRLTSDRPFDRNLYKFRADVEQLVAGFRDIAGHWAERQIVALNELSIINGTGPYRFEPNRGITRAEAAALTVRAFGVPAGVDTGRAAGYRDLKTTHWAYSAITQATAAGYMTGMPDGTFGADRLVTRAEIAVIIGRVLELKPLQSPVSFTDVEADHWAAPMLARLKQEGLIDGYPGNAMRPDQTASRAEFSVILYRAMDERGLT